MTRVATIDPAHPSEDLLEEAAQILRGGGLVAFATETVYGLGADATQADAIERIFAAKGRPSTNPLIVHVHDARAAARWVRQWPERAERLAAAFWPGPLTIILPRAPGIPDVVTGGLDTVGLRVPQPEATRGLIERTGRPIAAPSANRSNHVSPTRAEHVIADLEGRIDLVLDSGPTAVGVESTVLALDREQPTILRPGPITARDISDVLGVEVSTGGFPKVEPALPTPSPGMHRLHYAPRTPTLACAHARELMTVLGLGPGTAVLVFGTHTLPAIPADVPVRVLREPTEAAHELYDALRRTDALEPERIIVLLPPDEPQWWAIRDRLMRATASR